MVALGGIDGRIQFDHGLAGFDALAIADVNRVNHGKTLPGAVATISIVPIEAQASATQDQRSPPVTRSRYRVTAPLASIRALISVNKAAQITISRSTTT